MLCHQCYKDKPEHLIGKKTGICSNCLYGEREKKYRQKNKEKINVYFKKWYNKKGRNRRKKHNYLSRDVRIYNLYLIRKSKHFSVEAIAKIFQISTSRAYFLIRRERKKQEESS